MLRHLRVTNFAILSDITLDLTQGMNVITGETGAGKSLIVDAVNLLRGGRASADIPRTGTEQAVVEAIFEVPDFLSETVSSILKQAGIESEAELLVRRVIQKGGRSRTYINGALTTAKVLGALGGYLVDLSGQHQHQGLSDPTQHRLILDEYSQNQPLLSKMSDAWQAIADIDERIHTLSNAGKHTELVELARFQLRELREAELIAEEDIELEQKHAVLASADKLSAGCSNIEDLLYSREGSVVSLLDEALNQLTALSHVDSKFAELAEQLGEARAHADDVTRSLGLYSRDIENDPGQLAAIEERMALLRGLTKKYGNSLDAALTKQLSLETELKNFDESDKLLEEAQLDRSKTLKQAQKVAAQLTKARQQGAKRLSHEVQIRLSELGMKNASLDVRIEAKDALGPFGHDAIEVLFTPNKGETAKALSKIASGGELSRIMLAVKLVLRRADRVATYVFDEVDTGIGGATAEVVGQQIRSVANHRQVLCVTHLPQIAAFGDAHFRIDKQTINGRTETKVTKLGQNNGPTKLLECSQASK